MFISSKWAVRLRVVFLSGFAASASAQVFTPLGDLGQYAGHDYYTGSITGISADGSVVIGNYQSTPAAVMKAFRWTQDGGRVYLSTQWSRATGVSGDGSIVVGTTGSEAFRWTQDTGMVGLGHLGPRPDGSLSSQANGVSADGLTIVGGSTSDSHEESWWQAFRWTQDDGMVGLGEFSGEATGVSGDGSVIVGVDSSGYLQYRWTEATGIMGLYSSQESGANGVSVSADGSTIVGRLYSAQYARPAYHWTQATGVVWLPLLPGDWDGLWMSDALGVSGDGSSIVGWCFGRAVLWTQDNGIREMQDIIQNDYGIDLTGWTLRSATAISTDGRSIAGVGTNPSGQNVGWLFRFPAKPCLGDIADDLGLTAVDGGGPNGVVDFGDFAALLGLIGTCPGGTPGCLGDIADDFGLTAGEGGGPDGVVDFGDFAALLGLIGPCP